MTGEQSTADRLEATLAAAWREWSATADPDRREIYNSAWAYCAMRAVAAVRADETDEQRTCPDCEEPLAEGGLLCETHGWWDAANATFRDADGILHRKLPPQPTDGQQAERR